MLGPADGGGGAAEGARLVPAPAVLRRRCARLEAGRAARDRRRRSAGFPGPLATLRPGRYAVQAVVRLNPDTHQLGDGEGNAYGPVVRLELDPGDERHGRAWRRPPSFRPGRFRSPTASSSSSSPARSCRPSTAGRSATARPSSSPRAIAAPPAAHALHHPRVRRQSPDGAGDGQQPARTPSARDLIRVVLDPDCGMGHHVFADSATNGPRGRALVEELIPHIETNVPRDRRRRRPGCSTAIRRAGWSSLWLQVTYPDTFGGTWSTSPDPVDFRDFQQIDLYAPGENMFRDRDGNRRPIARRGGGPVLFFDDFLRGWRT